MAKEGLINKMGNKVIAYSFTVGVVIALILGIVSSRLAPTTVAVLTSVLIVMGIIIGFFNITHTEQRDYVFYVAAIVVVVALGGNNLGQLQLIGSALVRVLNSILAFIMPSVIIVGVRAVINLAKD